MPHYHRRRPVSLLSSGWDQVVPSRYSRQTKRLITGGRDKTAFCDVDSFFLRHPQLSWVLYSQAARAISIG